MKAIAAIKEKAKLVERETLALCLACRHPRTPWYAKAAAACVAGYALSPVDLIPDFIPVLGYLDDLLIVPAGIALTIRLIPPEVMAECRQKAGEAIVTNTLGRKAAGAVIVVWLIIAGLMAWAVFRYFMKTRW